MSSLVPGAGNAPTSAAVRVGIIAAMQAELAPLVASGPTRWTRTAGVYSGQLRLADGSLALAFAGSEGMGAAAATRAFAKVVAAAGPRALDAVVSYGWAGAITCGVKPPDVYRISEVIDSRTGERFQTAAPVGDVPLRLVTLDHVARAEEKRPLAERYKAVLVDMEAATIARLAVAQGIPFYCCKGISDGYTDILPDFNRFVNQAGQLRVTAFVAHSLLRPGYWRALNRLRENSARSAKALAMQLPACFQRSALLS